MILETSILCNQSQWYIKAVQSVVGVMSRSSTKAVGLVCNKRAYCMIVDLAVHPVQPCVCGRPEDRPQNTDETYGNLVKMAMN